jgi:hypothetical protein
MWKLNDRRYTTRQIELVRETSLIEDVASQYTQLHKVGGRLATLCEGPEHDYGPAIPFEFAIAPNVPNPLTIAETEEEQG